jgi:hypothetical protein
MNKCESLSVAKSAMACTKILALLVLCTSIQAARADNAVVLESFENGIAAASIAPASATPGGRPSLSPCGVSLSQYRKTGDSDSNVTDGGKSLKVVLSGKKKFCCDFQIQLSADASAKIRQAATSPDVGRYILRYDVIFPPLEDFVYFNSILYFGDTHDALISAGGKRSMSVALDLITGLPEKGPLTLLFFNDFDLKTVFTNVALYLDNIRLVDTYAPGTTARSFALQSFEDSKDPTGGAALFTSWDEKPINRTTLSQYTRKSAGDIRVSDGEHALEVSNTEPGPWHADFTLSFPDSKLAEVLKLNAAPADRLTPAQLARFTLRWDVTYPDLGDDWMNSTYHTTANYLPVIQVRPNKPGHQRRTYSITLDQIDWGAGVDGAPVLIFISEGPQHAPSAKVYYDNFRLIDTGSTPDQKVSSLIGR